MPLYDADGTKQKPIVRDGTAFCSHATTPAAQSINKICGIDNKSNIVKDEYVIQTMRYLELLKELKKSGNKDKKVI